MSAHQPEHLVTRSGVRLQVRPADQADETALAAFFDKVTPEDLRFRFLSTVRTPDHAARVAMLRSGEHVENLVAWGEDGDIIATAVLAGDDDHDRAEAAIILRADLKGRGIGWTLLDHLVARAREQGYAVVESIEERTNHGALQVENDMGFTLSPIEDDVALLRVSKQLR